MAARRHSREFWNRLVSEAEGSSIELTARRHRVRPGTLEWWKWKLGTTAKKPKRPAEAKLLPVVVTTSEAAATSVPLVAIELAMGLTVRVPVGSDVKYVAALLAAMRSTC